MYLHKLNPFKLFLLCAVFFSITRCRTTFDLTDNDRGYLKQQIDSMYAMDQTIREELYQTEVQFGVGRRSNGQFIPHAEKKNILGVNYPVFMKKMDSIHKKMNAIDEANTKKLLALTRQYGFPGKERLEVKKAKAYFIFVHADRKFFPEITEVLSIELNEGRISEYEYAYIMWHIEGRKGMMPAVDASGNVIY